VLLVVWLAARRPTHVVLNTRSGQGH